MELRLRLARAFSLAPSDSEVTDDTLVGAVESLIKDLHEARQGYHALDANWAGYHEACLKFIRLELGLGEASIPDMVQEIRQLRFAAKREPK